MPGDPYKLSVPQAFPKLGQLEARYGSLIKGQILGARERKKRGEVAKDRAPKFSFDEGLQVLPRHCARYLGDAVRLNTTVTRTHAKRPTGGRWKCAQVGRRAQAEHSAVIYAGTAFKLAELELQPMCRCTCEVFAKFAIRRWPASCSDSGARTWRIRAQGFGMLIPRVEGFKILGTIFSSSLFPNRAPAGHLTLTSYIGGERYPELASLPPEQLYELTCKDLRVLLGVKGKPTFQHSVFWPRAIPQYNVGYGTFREQMTEMEQKAPGLFLAGHYRDGISLSDSIVSGCNVADRAGQ